MSEIEIYPMPPGRMIVYPSLNWKWKPNTYCAVEVSFSRTNPVHRRLFFSGFLSGGIPAGYNEFFRASEHRELADAYYMRILWEVCDKDLRLPSLEAKP